ncbi:hypothetical protein GGR01_003754 [Acetobacter oeni]|nr:hypothetical protein [Acetobacter oeni]
MENNGCGSAVISDHLIADERDKRVFWRDCMMVVCLPRSRSQFFVT